MEYTLTRPLCFFDLETTGTDKVKDRIISISVFKIHPGHMPALTALASLSYPLKNLFEEAKLEEYKSLVNPGVPITQEITDLTGITNEMLATAPTFAEIAQELHVFCYGCDMAGYNINGFDIPMLVEHFLESRIMFPTEDTKMVDCFQIFRKMFPHNLAACFKHYTGQVLEGAHDASQDTKATILIWLKQIARHEEIGSCVADTHTFCQGEHPFADYAGLLVRDKEDDIVYNFGKHKGIKVRHESNYAVWMLKNDFPKSTKRVLERVLGFESSYDPAFSGELPFM